MNIFEQMDDIFFNEFKSFKESIDAKRDNFLYIDQSLLNEKLENIDNLDEVTEIHSGRINIRYKEIIFETVINLKKGDYLYVLLNGAKGEKVPQFSRWTYHSLFNGSMINIADPMYRIYEELELGWYYGNGEYNLREYLVDVVRRIANILQINSENIIFFGSSGGGAATIECASRIKGAKCVAINPQIVLSEYFYADIFGKITGNNLQCKDTWNRNNALYYLKNINGVRILIFNVRAALDMKQVKNICQELDISLKYGINVFGNLIIWLYDAECEPYVDGHCAQEYYCIVFVIEFILKNINKKDFEKEYGQFFRLINEFWYYKWKHEKELRNKMIDIEKLIYLRELKKKVVLWGCGEIAKKLSREIFDIQNNNYYNIQLVIDNNEEKTGTFFENKILINHPSQISEWSEYFIIIALNNNRECVVNELESRGLKHGINYIYWNDLCKMCMY